MQINDFAKTLTLENIVNPKYKNINLDTIVDYLKNLNILHKSITGSKIDFANFNFNFFKDTLKIEKHIESSPSSITTKTKRYSSLISILSRLNGFEEQVNIYRALQNKNQSIVSSHRNENLLTKREDNNWLDWNDIKNHYNPLWTLQDLFLKSLITAIPPRRLEYGLLKISRHKTLPWTLNNMSKNFNYIITSRSDTIKYIVLNNYKTVKKYGVYIINFKQADSSLFKYSYIRNLGSRFIKNMKHNEIVFKNNKGEMHVNFGKRITKLFEGTGKSISCDILRHSFISYFLNNHNLMTVSNNTLDILSRSMGHSTPQFLSYRKIIN